MRSLLHLFAIIAAFFASTCAPTLAANNPANIPAIPSIAAMVALGQASAQYQTAQVNSYYAGKNSGGGIFNWTVAALAPGGACTADGGIVFLASGVSASVGCWVRVVSYPYHAAWWGPDLTGATDSTLQLQAAFNAVILGPPLIVDCGDYKITSAISMTTFAATMVSGQSQSNPSFPPTDGCANIVQATNNTPIFAFTGSSFSWSIENVALSWANQQTGSDPLAIGFYFNCSGCTFARIHIERISISHGYSFFETNHTGTLPSFFDNFIRDSSYENMAGSFLDNSTAGTVTSSSGNDISGNDIRGGLTVTGHPLINMEAWSGTFDNNTFGQNNTLPVMDLNSVQLSGGHWKIAEGATLDRVGSVVICSTGNIVIQSFEATGAVTPTSGKIYGFNGNCNVNIQGQVEFAFTGTGFSQYFANAGPTKVGFFVDGPTGTSTNAWTDIPSTGGVSDFTLDSLTPYSLGADVGDASIMWTPGTSSNVIFFNTPLTSDRDAQVANTYNLDSQTCERVLRGPGATGASVINLKDPGGTIITTLTAPGAASICYKRTAGINTTTWYPGP